LNRLPSILIVDDDPSTTRLVRSHLERGGYHARSVANGRAALDVITDAVPDLVILDPMLSSLDGYAMCAEIRAFSRVPVVMLAAKGEQEDKLRGFAVGADDYLVKPFSPQELVARVGAVLRRSQQSDTPAAPALLRFGTLAIDVLRRRVTVAGEAVKLTPTEFGLLHHLARHAGKVLSHTQLLTEVWGPEYRDDREYLWVYIRRLRRKLEPDPEHPTLILSEPGFGYVLDATSAAP
jgi:DNA-binding response OmpR family regulator